MIRTILMLTMILSFMGLGLYDCIGGKWRTDLASLLLGIVQFLIFRRPIQ